MTSGSSRMMKLQVCAAAAALYLVFFFTSELLWGQRRRVRFQSCLRSALPLRCRSCLQHFNSTSCWMLDTWKALSAQSINTWCDLKREETDLGSGGCTYYRYKILNIPFCSLKHWFLNIFSAGLDAADNYSSIFTCCMFLLNIFNGE